MTIAAGTRPGAYEVEALWRRPGATTRGRQRKSRPLRETQREARDLMLNAGAKLGPYEITGAVGAGGMGEVYQAHDTKLGRDVAIRVLPKPFAHDSERLSRFQREAKMLAALKHPHIATIFGLEHSDGVQYLVMELVSGETLADRVKREGAIPIEEALAIAKQIAEALEAAHEKGTIHRDLKSAIPPLAKTMTVSSSPSTLSHPLLHTSLHS